MYHASHWRVRRVWPVEGCTEYDLGGEDEAGPGSGGVYAGPPAVLWNDPRNRFFAAGLAPRDDAPRERDPIYTALYPSAGCRVEHCQPHGVVAREYGVVWGHFQDFAGCARAVADGRRRFDGHGDS